MVTRRDNSEKFPHLLITEIGLKRETFQCSTFEELFYRMVQRWLEMTPMELSRWSSRAGKMDHIEFTVQELLAKVRKECV